MQCTMIRIFVVVIKNALETAAYFPLSGGALTFTVPVTTIDALQHFETG